ncbi:MAG: hypothetical protein ACXWQZ_01040 [Ktedonobacterales bacterium]
MHQHDAREAARADCTGTGLDMKSEHSPPPALTPRQGAILFAKASEQLTEWQRDHLVQVFARDPAICPVHQIVQAFGTMVRTRGGEDLDRWPERAEDAGYGQSVTDFIFE